MDVTIVCVPFQMDVARWGYALGPQAFLDAGLVQRIEAQGHTVREPIWIDLPIAERTRDIVTNLGRIAQRTSDAVSAGLARDDSFVLVLEGDCTHAVGAIGGLARAQRETPGVAWFDAHGDLQTMATTTSGYVGGMPYAVALGWEFDDWRAAAGLEAPVRPEAAALIGASDLDEAEIMALERSPIARIDADQLLETGTAEHVAELLRQRAAEAPSWYLHLDIDVAGPETAPGGMTPAPHWPPRQHLIDSVGAAAHTLPVRVAAIATYNPAGDPAGKGASFGIDAAAAILAR
ncbi:MAG: arginase family protein [Ktedonobacterales bacterium]